MWRKNEKLRLNGKKYVAVQELGVGAFGEAWLVRRCADDAAVVLKRFFRCEQREIARLEALRDLQLNDRLSNVACVSEVIRPAGGRSWAGYFMPWAAGVDLSAWLTKTEFNVLDNVCLCIQIAKTLADSHRLEVAHGDVHFANVKVQLHNEVPIARLVDWDNAAIRGLPAPRSPGALAFLAPESIRAYQTRRHLPPSIQTEQCSAAKTFHWLFFGRSCLASVPPDRLEEEAAEGSWDSDPVNGRVDFHQLGGITNTWISPEIADLFRRALGKDPERRPPMTEWVSAMLKVVDEGVSLCPFCSAPMMLAPRCACPHCERTYGHVGIHTENGRRIVFRDHSIVIGREDLPSPRVSCQHAMLSQLGPEAFVTDLNSRNGTYRRLPRGWVRLPSRRRCPIRPGERIRFGDVTVRVIAA